MSKIDELARFHCCCIAHSRGSHGTFSVPWAFSGTNPRHKKHAVATSGFLYTNCENAIKAEIERLPGKEFAELFRWLSEKEWGRWDREIEADSQAGRLDFLVREAREEKAKGTLKAGKSTK